MSAGTKPVDPLPRSHRSDSPCRYPGGKFYARRLGLDELPPPSGYPGPCCGGAGVFFAKEPSKSSLLNDRDEEVINTLRQLRDRGEDLIRLPDEIPATKQMHDCYNNRFEPENVPEQVCDGYISTAPPAPASCVIKTATGATAASIRYDLKTGLRTCAPYRTDC